VCCIHPNFLSVFPEKSAIRKLEVIRASPTAWSVTQVLFGLGALVTAIGVGLLAYALRRQPSAWLIWVSVAVLVSAAVLWLWHLYRRTVDPVAFAEGRCPAGPCWRTSC
jgi:membrane protein YdbS with pleckstrin-like domain